MSESEVRERLAEALDEHVELLLCLDFDGTLAEIVDDPREAELRAGNRERLRDLRADPRVALAVVSGRELDDVRSRVGLDGIVYAGNHGMELARGDADPGVHPTVAEHADALDDVCERLVDRFEGAEGVEVEHKGQSATVHYRHADGGRTPEIEDAVEAVVAEVEGDLHVTDGKQIFELRPPVDWDKGRVVELLDESRGEACLTVYVGDDVTDEDAFRAIQPAGIGVLVGDREDTDARLRVEDPAAVTDLLGWLAEEGLDALDADPGELETGDPPAWKLPDWASDASDHAAGRGSDDSDPDE